MFAQALKSKFRYYFDYYVILNMESKDIFDTINKVRENPNIAIN